MIQTASAGAAGRCGGATSRWCRRAARGRGRALWREEERGGRRSVAQGSLAAVCSARVADAAAGAGAAGSCGGAADRWCRRTALGRLLRQGLEKVARWNVGGVGRRAAKCVDLHARDHEERGEEGPFVAGQRAPRRAISPRPRTGHPPEHRGMGAAVEQAKGRGGGGGGSAPTWRACRRGLGGTTPRPHCWRHRPTQ